MDEVLWNTNNRLYEGYWDNDLRHGEGFEIFKNNYYIGGFHRGKAHGKGIYKWHTGEVYDGEWKDGTKNGYGVWKGKSGDSYVGEWVNSKAHGYGVHTWPSGDKYEGEWREWLKHGQGTDFFANGDTFTGTYINGKPYGKGKYTWENGSWYTGDFKNGLKHGKGRWQKGEGELMSVYEGEYVNDKKEGQGVFRWASGNIYEGQFKDDERHGKGKMIWTDGSWYDGEWSRGIQHGYGVITFGDGSEKEGYFDNNVFIGKMKEDSGNFVTLDPSKIFPNSHKLDKSRSVKKMKYDSLHGTVKDKIDSLMVNRNRPKALMQSKYIKGGDHKLPSITSSLPKLKSPLLTTKTSKLQSKSGMKWYTGKRVSSKTRTIIR